MVTGYGADAEANFYVGGAQLKNVDNICYLGSVISNAGSIDNEVQRRIGLACSAFGKVASSLFLSRDLSVKTRVRVYRAICLSVLLHSSETWVPYRRNIRTRFHIGCLQRILGLKWWDRLTHVEIRRREGIDPVEIIMAQRRIRWISHGFRMLDNRLPKRVFYGQLTEGRRSSLIATASLVNYLKIKYLYPMAGNLVV